ncbi:hypothetical protein [Actinomadura sp. BRA 177]|nr:hypothetical protein [Actinomadura sp. BRA 177]
MDDDTFTERLRAQTEEFRAALAAGTVPAGTLSSIAMTSTAGV